VKIIKPGREVKPDRNVWFGICSRCGAEIEISDEEEHALEGGDYPCPTKNCGRSMIPQTKYVEEDSCTPSP
jgi:hypothetical protein